MIHLLENVEWQLQAAKHGRGRHIGTMLKIGVGDGTAALPVAFPKSALAPVAAYIVFAWKIVPRDEIGAKQETVGVLADQIANLVPVFRDLAHLPFRRARVEKEMRVFLQQMFQVV